LCDESENTWLEELVSVVSYNPCFCMERLGTFGNLCQNN